MPSPAVLIGADPAPVLQIDLHASTLSAVPLPTLMAVARRDNPKRARLVVSRVLGKHLNVPPTTAVAAGTALGQLTAAMLGPTSSAGAVDVLVEALLSGQAPAVLLPRAEQGPPAIVIAYAETATAIGHLVRRALGPGPMLHTTRALPPSGALLSFAEPHSHAVEHQLFHDDLNILDPPTPVVLVDDELTTGRTAMNTIDAIERVAPRDLYIIATYLDLRSDDDRAALAAFALRRRVRVEVVCLVSGTTSVVGRTLGLAERAVERQPAPSATERSGLVRLHVGARATARRGWTEGEQADVEAAAECAASQLEPYRSGPRAIVIGTEELMFVPMLLGAHLSGDVQMRSTTRSPILVSGEPGYPITDGLAYPAPDGSGGRRYLYNLHRDVADDVFLCCEEGAAYRRSPLLAALLARHQHVHIVELVP